jgi:AAA15 family ATPase/GTPase
MLSKLRLKNFKSIKEETIIDFSATKYMLLSKTNLYNGITKGTMFVGGNASGKGNLINSIGILLDLLFANTTIDMSNNFCFFSKDKSMILEYHFKFDDDIVIYYIEVDKTGSIEKEILTLNNIVQINRLGLEAETILTEKKRYNSLDIDSRTLFVKVIYFNTKFSSFPILARWMQFLSNSIYFNVHQSTLLIQNPGYAFDKNNIINISQYLDKNGTSEINRFLKLYNFNLEIIYTDEQSKSKNQTSFPSGIKTIYFKRTYLEKALSINMESVGNKTLLQILPSLLHVVDNECMFIVDEFNSAFHNELEELIVRYFMENAKNSQLFFVSHSTNLMRTTLLRPDQIYTVDFFDADGSKIKRVSSESPRENQNLEKMYLSGIFDGLPNYSKDED